MLLLQHNKWWICFNIKGIVHFGIAGNVNDSLSIGDVTVPKQIGHTGIWDWKVHIYLSSLYNLVSLLIFIYVFFFFFLWLIKVCAPQVWKILFVDRISTEQQTLTMWFTWMLQGTTYQKV